jgi:hypothetical protein
MQEGKNKCSGSAYWAISSTTPKLFDMKLKIILSLKDCPKHE